MEFTGNYNRCTDCGHIYDYNDICPNCAGNEIEDLNAHEVNEIANVSIEKEAERLRNLLQLHGDKCSNEDLATALLHSVSNWVATSKMPEFDGLYLCYIKQPQECGNVWEYCKVVDCNYNKWIVQTNEEVTHWRSLPEPPCC